MVQINFALKEVNCKVVYYGPGLSGKTTNLEVVHAKAPSTHVGDLTSIATEGDRTLFFDFLPLNLGKVAGMNTKFQIYTVPGQVYYNSTRKLVLQGADGIVFVADSRKGKMDENLESLANLEENLQEYGMDPKVTPLVLQYNKRDLPDIHTIEQMQEKLNKYGSPYFEAVAVKGDGVFPTLKKLSSMVLESLNRQHSSTAVRRHSKSKEKAREMVGATAGAKGARASASQRPSPAAGPTSSKVAARGPRTAEEKSVDLPGIKPIKRRSPPTAKGSRAAGGTVPAVVRKRSQIAIPKARIEGKKRGRKAIWITLLLAIAGGAAAVYFSGIWRKFLG